MHFEDRTTDRQAQPHALGLGGLKRGEQLGQRIRGQAGPGIDDGDARQIRAVAARGLVNRSSAARFRSRPTSYGLRTFVRLPGDAATRRIRR